MNRKAFTLIELLAVITILSLVALVTSISVANMVKESKDELSDAQMKSIKAAAESWGADNISDLPTGNDCSYLTLNDLKDEGLLDSNITDPKNKSIISNDLKIKITSKLNGKGKSVLNYEVNPKNVDGCTYIGSPIYVDVPTGFTPIVYVDESTTEEPTKGYWKVPNLNEEWYNYDNQMWANAAVLNKTKKAGEKLEEEDILMMYVYIPRFEYRIIRTYGTHTSEEEGTQDLPGEIEVKFINNSQSKADDTYILHPAFTFGTEEMSGMWVGKFELSSVGENLTTNNNLGCDGTTCTSDITNLRILPNVPSLRYNNISNFFYAIKGISTSFGLSNIDTHMMKNSEWGAVAYLSQSRYGKYGNTDYDNKYKEVYQNKSDTFITGSSNGTPSQSGYRSGGQCSYNDMQDLGKDGDNKMGQCGPGASTTGNIYGVYDMSGGVWEYVMGAYAENGYPKISSSGFSSDPNVFTSGTIDPKYYDIYKTSTANTACGENGVCYGHGLSETSGWYGDDASMVISSYPWFVRGGGYNIYDSPGVFNFNNNNGNSYYGTSARVVGFAK